MILTFWAALSLGDAVRQAATSNVDLRAAGLRIEETGEQLRAAEGALDPTIGLTLGASTQRETGTGLTGRVQEFNLTAGELTAEIVQPLVWGTRLRLGWDNSLISTDNQFRNCIPGVESDACYESRLVLELQQPLLRGGGRRVFEAPAETARAEGDVARKQRQATAALIVEGVVVAYAELTYARAQRTIREQAVGLAEQQLAATQARIEGGQLAPVDLPVVEQAVAERRQALYLATQAEADRAATLTTALGQPDAAAPEVEPPALDPWTAPEPAAREAALAQNPDLVVLDAEIARQATQLTLLEDATQPQLDLFLSATQSGLDESAPTAVANIPENDNHLYAAQLALAFPWGNRTAEGRLAQARLALDRARLARDSRALALRRESAEAWRALRTTEEAERLAGELANFAQRTLDAERQKFELGRSTNLDVLRVQQQYAEALLAVQRARIDRLLAVTRLQRLTGALLPAFGLTLE